MLSDPPISATTVTCEEKSENLQIKPKQVTKLQKNFKNEITAKKINEHNEQR